MKDSLVLIDTSVWIPALRKASFPPFRERVQALLAENRVAILPVIYLELLGGAGSQPEFERLKRRLEALHWVPIDEKGWEAAALLAFKLRRRGKPLPSTDVLVGAVALTHDLIVLHADRHYDIMAQEVPLEVESMVSLLG